jgi:hypothetical protein
MLRYQDMIDEQRAGNVHGVFIDDTGSPGLKETPGNLHPNRKTWVAVVIPKDQISEVWKLMPKALKVLDAKAGAGEFHFTDIYGGTRQFKGIPLKERLEIFAFMAEVFQYYQFPTFVQTFDPVSAQELRNRGDFPKQLGPFNLEKHEDLALFFCSTAGEVAFGKSIFSA